MALAQRSNRRSRSIDSSLPRQRLPTAISLAQRDWTFNLRPTRLLPGPNRNRWNPGNDRSRRHVLGDDRTGANNCILTDRDPFEYGRFRPDPHALANGNRCRDETLGLPKVPWSSD